MVARGVEKGLEVAMHPKKSFAMVDYRICDPGKCDPKEGRCAAAKACSHKVLKQLDGPFEAPMVFHDLCQGCWDCVEACPLEAVKMKHFVQ